MFLHTRKKNNSWDTRKAESNTPIHNIEAHQAEINCVAFNPKNEFLLATGSADKVFTLALNALYDINKFD